MRRNAAFVRRATDRKPAKPNRIRASYDENLQKKTGMALGRVYTTAKAADDVAKFSTRNGPIRRVYLVSSPNVLAGKEGTKSK